MKSHIVIFILLFLPFFVFASWENEWEEGKGMEFERYYTHDRINEVVFGEIFPLKFAALLCVRVFQELPFFKDRPKCVFYPSCSRFCMHAIKEYGAFPGMIIGLNRVMRCTPDAYNEYYEVDKRKKLFFDPPADWKIELPGIEIFNF